MKKLIGRLMENSRHAEQISASEVTSLRGAKRRGNPLIYRLTIQELDIT